MDFVNLNRLPELQLAPGIMARVVTAQAMTVAHVTLEAGALLPLHTHVNEQLVNVVEGHLELTVDGVKHDLVPGTVMVLAPNIPHSGKAITNCRVIDVFHPIREDFRQALERLEQKKSLY